MGDYKAAYTQATIVKDETDGLVKVETLQRHGQERKTKLKNNFGGLLASADSSLLLQLATKLAAKLPPKTGNETVVGMYKSGIIMCGFLALARESKFNWSTPDMLGDYESAFSFSEDRRDKVHYLYGIKSGDTVVIIEDEVTSGNGVVALIKALKEFGVNVVGVCCVIETVTFGGRKNIADNTGLDLVSLVQVDVS